ncbi:DUF4377 domain-containing protein [Candidatus Nomurabacteria bacterium]|nr:DUF4377 domain-containing protein [Candidatus Nomurabacteria bacterium]
MKKSITIIIVLIVLALIAWFIIATATKMPKNQVSEPVAGYAFTTTDGTSGAFTFTSPDNTSMALMLGGVSYDLNQTPSASGTRYANADESVVYWEHQGEATIEIGGTTYSTPALNQAELLSFTIAPNTVDCVGVGPMKCLVVNGEYFYDHINGFDFVEGNEYEIIVARTEREDAPADASIYEYQLVEVISVNGSKTDGYMTPDNTLPVINPSEYPALQDDDVETVEHTTPEGSLDEATEDEVEAEAETPLLRYSPEGTSWSYNGGTLTFQDGRYMADFGCNSISGSFSVERTELTFDMPISTKMACEEDIMTKEQSFAEMIVQMDTFSETETGALLSGDGVEMALEK